MKKQSIAALLFVAISFGGCFALSRSSRYKKRRGSFSRQHELSGVEKLRSEIFSIHKMLRKISKRELSKKRLRSMCDRIVEDMVDEYIDAQGGTPSGKRKNGVRKYSKREQKYLESFGKKKMDADAKVMDYELESMAQDGDYRLEYAIDIVLARYVAKKAGAQMPTAQVALAKELRSYGIKVKGIKIPRGERYEDEEESTLWKLIKWGLGIGAIAGGTTCAMYHFGVDKEKYKNPGLLNWALARNGTSMFSLEASESDEPAQE